MEGVKDNKELLLITTKVSNPPKHKCSNLQSASTLRGFGRVGKALKRRIPPSITLQPMQANNVKCSVAVLDKPCTRPAQCTHEKHQARAPIRTQGHSNSLQQWERTVSRGTESRATSVKNPRSTRRPRTSQRPQSLHWPLKVLLQWLNFRQKLHSTCEFNKTWQPLFRSAALEEARPSNKSLDALGGVYITYTTALRCIWILDALALERFAPSGIVRLKSIYTSAPWYN